MLRPSPQNGESAWEKELRTYVSRRMRFRHIQNLLKDDLHSVSFDAPEVRRRLGPESVFSSSGSWVLAAWYPSVFRKRAMLGLVGRFVARTNISALNA